MRIVSQTIMDQTGMISAETHTFMRENFGRMVVIRNFQVHHLEIEDASNYSKKKESQQCLPRVIP